MLSTLPFPPIRRFRKRAPAQRAAIERSLEARKIRKIGGGREIVSAVLGPLGLLAAPAAPKRTHSKLSTCHLCGKRLTSRESGHAVWFNYLLAHESCVMNRLPRSITRRQSSRQNWRFAAVWLRKSQRSEVNKHEQAIANKPGHTDRRRRSNLLF